jgi:hypothetical protein
VAKKERLEPIDQIVIFDVLSAKQIIRKPVSLYDAWVQSIMIPLVEIAKDDIELFKHRYKDRWADKWGKDGEDFLLQINFSELIPERHWPKVLDWSYSNLTTLYDVGYEAGQRFFEKNRVRLTTRQPAAEAAA